MTIVFPREEARRKIKEEKRKGILTKKAEFRELLSSKENSFLKIY